MVTLSSVGGADQSALPAPHAALLQKVALCLSAADREAFFPKGLTTSGTNWMLGAQIDPTTPGWTEHLITARPAIILTGWSTPSLEVVLTMPETPVRYICNITGSVRRVVPRSFVERGGCVSNWGGAVAPMVAEHALLLALASLRELPEWAAYIAKDRRERAAAPLRTKTLFGRNVGLHGFGGVAQQLVGLLRAFEVKLHCYSAGVPANLIRAHGVVPCDSLEDLFTVSDVLFECEALTLVSTGSVNSACIGRLPSGALFVNVARGRIVEEHALLAAARAGRIRIALDVLCDEPATAQSPALAVPGAVVSPHIGGPTRDFYPQLGEKALANVSRFAAGLAPEPLLTLEEYDRST